MEFDLRAGLAVRACPLRSGSKVKEAFADSSGKSPVEGQIFTFFTVFCSFYRCFTRKVAGRKKLYFERCFLLFQRNMFFSEIFLTMLGNVRKAAHFCPK